MNAESLLKVCKQVQKDVEADVIYYDGKPFTGKNVAEYLGKQGACIGALAEIVEELIKHVDSKALTKIIDSIKE